MSVKQNRSSLFTMTATAFLMALIAVLMLTGLGYIPIGPLTLTILTLPVAVGGTVLGPKSGLILGAVFGLTSFFTCFGTDALGALLLSVNPVATFLVCLIPRMLCGLLPALLHTRWRSALSGYLCCALTALLNTAFFLSMLWLFFADTLTANYGTASLWALFAAFAGVNAVVETATDLVIGGAVSHALLNFRKKRHI